MSEYDLQAKEFLEKTGTTITKEFVGYKKFFHNDKEPRNVWSITLKNKEGLYTFEFGDSIVSSAKFHISEDLKIRNLLRKLLEHLEINNKINWSRTMINIKYDDEYTVKKYIRKAFPSEFQQDIVYKQRKHLIEIEPSDYSILASLDILYSDNFETFETFCSEFGYDTDSISARNTYQKCIEQDRMLRRLYDKKELELLSLIN